MRITSFSDYGLRSLMYLALLPDGELSSVAKVASAYQVSQNHLTKVIGQLRKCGYIEAIRGKGGGIRLAKSPHLIRIGQVLRDMESHHDGVDCMTAPCALTPNCRLKQALADAVQSFFESMDNYTLADLVTGNHEVQQVITIEQPSNT